MSDWLLIDGARRLLADTCTHEVVQAAEADGWSAAVWDALAGAGYASLSELALADALAVLTSRANTPRRCRWRRRRWRDGCWASRCRDR